MTETSRLTVGQTLWRGSRYFGGPCTVTKIGRKWASLNSGERIDIKTMQLEGCGTQIFLSEAHYLRELEDWDAWQMFYRAVSDRRSKPPADAQTIRQAAALLGIELPPGSVA
jgi:hypothetical protein